MPELFRIVLTGGPCAGKTTASALLAERLEEMGWRVFAVPETASILLNGGVSFYSLSKEQVAEFQKQLLLTMLRLEDAFTGIARSCGQKCVVICDRGAMDPSAYMEPEMWRECLDELGYTEVGLRDSRYDCVVHLVTAADGAQKFYTTIQNTVRTESPELAIELDGKIKKAWLGHSYLQVIHNKSTDFADKMERVFETVTQFIGQPVKSRGLKKRKWLVSGTTADESVWPVESHVFEVAHDYLITADETQARIRRRGNQGNFVFTHTVRFPPVHGQARLQTRRILSGREYASMRSLQADSRHRQIIKRRLNFEWQETIFELDTFETCRPGLRLLEAYTSCSNDAFALPPWIQVEREVTKESEYSMFHLSKKITIGDQIRLQHANMRRDAK